MNLIIDIGNTQAKVAVFEGNKMVFRIQTDAENIFKKIEEIQKKYENIEKAIVSSVGKLDKNSFETLKKDFQLLFLDHNTVLPFKNLYSTPKTLGIDRIALVCSCVEKYANKNVLIIDAGTCITYDFITGDNEYYGGAISPGLRMRYKALHNQTAKLPLLSSKVPDGLIGNSTEQGIHSGVFNGVVFEIEGAIQTYRKKYGDLTVILTGGDTKMLSKQLKSSIFANSNHLLEGLNFILQFNTN
ncbi:type III pantothenate kinase [Bizionia gelidisalsuginis]|uniref:Type III pantothenate kinase n=1 Tax=Bizionia gelidisalsuginis TaxID=291188 RepID=A0ABY3MA08_9FLAO|nr:type III pantothenate kinase [Bizionia gelidisalsuginis]TYC12118.1 type III pantothenate kinase [Bizionia gelidisalsuginis]